MYKSTLSGAFFALIVRKKIPSVNFFTLALLLTLWTNIRYDHNLNVQNYLGFPNNFEHLCAKIQQKDCIFCLRRENYSIAFIHFFLSWKTKIFNLWKNVVTLCSCTCTVIKFLKDVATTSSDILATAAWNWALHLFCCVYLIGRYIPQEGRYNQKKAVSISPCNIM